MTALSHSLLVELAITPVLLTLLSLLPSRARPEAIAAEAGDEREQVVALEAISA